VLTVTDHPTAPTLSFVLAVPDVPSATGRLDDLRDHAMPWGKHRQGGFTDPFGPIWFVGDRSSLKRVP
jgi:hypothetical protein